MPENNLSPNHAEIWHMDYKKLGGRYKSYLGVLVIATTAESVFLASES